MSIVEGIKEWIREHRTLTFMEKEQLTAQWYDLLSQLMVLCCDERVAWIAEWDRLVRNDQPRPHCYERLAAIRMDKMAKQIASGTGLYLSVTEEGMKDHVRITATSLKCRDEMIASIIYRV